MALGDTDAECVPLSDALSLWEVEADEDGDALCECVTDMEEDPEGDTGVFDGCAWATPHKATTATARSTRQLYMVPLQLPRFKRRKRLEFLPCVN